MPSEKGSIGVFDSGYGGLTILKDIVAKLPAYNYIYLGDNARSPYGSRSFETVYHYTLQCVKWFFAQGCPLVILACNTASAKALRTIQQKDLIKLGDEKRVLGIVRPTSEVIGQYSKTCNVGILATTGTVQSESYPIEIKKFFPDVNIVQEACPMWVPLVENNEHEKSGADYFIKKNITQLLQKNKVIDTVLLACTHYPLLLKKIKEYMPVDVNIISQGEIVSTSLADYLFRHPEMESSLLKENKYTFFTTDSVEDFDKQGEIFFGEKIRSIHVDLE